MDQARPIRPLERNLGKEENINIELLVSMLQD